MPTFLLAIEKNLLDFSALMKYQNKNMFQLVLKSNNKRRYATQIVGVAISRQLSATSQEHSIPGLTL